MFLKFNLLYGEAKGTIGKANLMLADQFAIHCLNAVLWAMSISRAGGRSFWYGGLWVLPGL